VLAGRGRSLDQLRPDRVGCGDENPLDLRVGPDLF
jgi:hypothetical protein